MFTRKQLSPFFNGIATLCLAIVVLAGCNSKTVVDDTPTGSTMTVSVSPSTVQKNSTAVVEATVVTGSTPLPNRIVNFTVSPSNTGYFTPASDTTDANGIAATIFTATVSGSANVSASVEGTSVTGVRAVTVTDAPQAGSGNVTISVTPSLLLANGADTSLVTITVRDAQAQLAPNGTTVKLTAGEKFVDLDGNGYWTPNVDSLVFDANPNGLWDAIGFIPSTVVVAGGAGAATASFVSGSSALTVYLKATVDDNGITGNGEVQLQLSPDATVNSIYLSSDSIQLAVKSTGGIETGFIRATCYDANGNRAPENIGVNFIITDGPGGGEHLENVGYGPFSSSTNTQGVASVALHAGTVSGTVRIRAYVDTVLSNATQVLISSGPPAYIVIGAEDCNVPYWDNVAELVDIVAVVSDIYLNPVSDSTVVYFSTDEGSMKSHENRTNNDEGIASTIWISGNNVPTADGIVMIMAETAGGTVADTSFFYNSHTASNIFATGMPASILGDGVSKFSVIVTGLDFNGNFVVGGTTMRAEASILGVSVDNLQDGCNSSTARSEISSKTLTFDASLTGANDDGIGAVDQITYWSPGGGEATYSINITTGIANKSKSEWDAPGNALLGEIVVLTVTVRDRFGNPLGDHTLTLTATGGAVSNGSQETDGSGEASGFTWTAPGAAASVSLTITDSDPRGGISFTKGVVVE